VRLPDTTRSALRELLLAELADAGSRAGWPPGVLAEVLDARLKSAAEDAGEPPAADRA
jgi:hypothetical protein